MAVLQEEQEETVEERLPPDFGDASETLDCATAAVKTAAYLESRFGDQRIEEETEAG
jgi:hypothetical protein